MFLLFFFFSYYLPDSNCSSILTLNDFTFLLIRSSQLFPSAKRSHLITLQEIDHQPPELFHPSFTTKPPDKMHATMMNFYPLTCQSMVVSPPDPTIISPSGTPSPPAIGYHHHDILRRSYHPYHHQPIKTYNNNNSIHQQDLNKAVRTYNNNLQQEINKASRPKRSFTIEAILGLNEDRDFVGAVRYEGRRERLMRQAPYAPAATPRTALTALLPSSPESSPKKDGEYMYFANRNSFFVNVEMRNGF